MKVEEARKLTIRNCGFGRLEILAALTIVGDDKKVTMKPDTVPLLRIAGSATSAKPGQSDLGEYLRLVGSFFADNLMTGQRFHSAACILPNFVSESLGEALKTNPAVEFGLLLSAKADATSATGYVFTVESLFDAEYSDPVQRLLTRAGMSVPKLEAPADPPAPPAPADPQAPAPDLQRNNPIHPSSAVRSAATRKR